MPATLEQLKTRWQTTDGKRRLEKVVKIAKTNFWQRCRSLVGGTV